MHSESEVMGARNGQQISEVDHTHGMCKSFGCVSLAWLCTRPALLRSVAWRAFEGLRRKCNTSTADLPMTLKLALSTPEYNPDQSCKALATRHKLVIEVLLA